MADISSADERPHESSEAEWWHFDAYSAADDLGVWVEFGWDRTRRSGWYIGIVTAVAGPVVLVVDHHVPLAALSPSLEFRAEGIWAQHVCETPLDHWTLGLEAFGVTLDAPEDAAGDQWGARTAVGLDLEWEAVAGPEADAAGFTQACGISGEVLIDDRVIDFDGRGSRSRRWLPGGVESPSQTGLVIPVRLDRPAGPASATVALTSKGTWTVDHVELQ